QLCLDLSLPVGVVFIQLNIPPRVADCSHALMKFHGPINQLNKLGTQLRAAARCAATNSRHSRPPRRRGHLPAAAARTASSSDLAALHVPPRLQGLVLRIGALTGRGPARPPRALAG